MRKIVEIMGKEMVELSMNKADVTVTKRCQGHEDTLGRSRPLSREPQAPKRGVLQ
jgi:hypothetical protein